MAVAPEQSSASAEADASPATATAEDALEQLAVQRAMLTTIVLEEARFGGSHTAEATLYALAEVREQIRRAKAALRARGVAVADLPGEAISAERDATWPPAPLRLPATLRSPSPAAEQLPLPGELAPAPVPAPAPDTGRTAPTGLGDYAIHEQLAEAEHGAVFRATHRRSGREAFVHILPAEADVAQQIGAAASQLAQIAHPHLAPIIAAGPDVERQAVYIVTPPLRLRTLADALAGGPLEATRALYMATQLADALDALHARGMAHGEVQPGQVLLAPAGDAYLLALSLHPAGAEEQARDRADLLALLRVALRIAEPAAAEQLGPSIASEAASATAMLDSVRERLPASVVQAAGALRATRWEPAAAWLENPLETVLGAFISADFLRNSRARAVALHQQGAIGHQLERGEGMRWPRPSLPTPGSAPEQIVSYNLYFYELSVHYETRAAIRTSERPTDPNAAPPLGAPDSWAVAVPYVEPFIDVPAQPISTSYAIECAVCHGSTRLTCGVCGGDGALAHTHWFAGEDSASSSVVFREPCAPCGGRGWLDCARCAGSGLLHYDHSFTWSRQGRRYWNEDDLGHMLGEKRVLTRETSEVFRGRIDPYAGHWHLTAPLRELLQAGILGGGPDSRPRTVELVIRGAPVTEVDYGERDGTRTLALIGFKNLVRVRR